MHRPTGSLVLFCSEMSIFQGPLSAFRQDTHSPLPSCPPPDHYRLFLELSMEPLCFAYSFPFSSP